jgi:arsenate reductase
MDRIRLYGITHCNTVKNARAWLASHKVETLFHDFQKQGVTQDMLKKWSRQVGWEKLLNRQGITWRKLPDAAKNRVKDEVSAIGLMLEKPTVIKRPVLEKGSKTFVGFHEAYYQSIFK